MIILWLRPSAAPGWKKVMTDRPDQTTALSRDYPPPPWMLWGSALTATFAVRAAAVAAFVPAPLKLLTLPRGLAIGYLAIWRYGPGSTLEYSELIAGVLVRHKTRPGPYVTHIAVDNPRSQRAGREIWHLPKQLWRFEWEFDPKATSVQVWDGVRLVCRASNAATSARLWPVRANLPFLNPVGENITLLIGDADVRVSPLSWRLQLGNDGPLASFAPVGPVVTAVVKGNVQVPPLRTPGT